MLRKKVWLKSELFTLEIHKTVIFNLSDNKSFDAQITDWLNDQLSGEFFH